jgi:hypothetical protein
MTRTGRTKHVDKATAYGRLRKAIAFHKATQMIHTMMSDVGAADVMAANAVLATIAYADAMTAAILGQINQQDHKGVTALLRDALQNKLPTAEESRLRRLIDRKGEASYGDGLGRPADSDAILSDLDKFASFAIQSLRDRGVYRTSELDTVSPPATET